MMPALSSNDTSVLGRWWFTVDRWTIAAVVGLICFGYVMMLAASPGVAERVIKQSLWFLRPRELFIGKQMAFLVIAFVVMVVMSLLSPKGVRRVALAGCTVAIILTALTLLTGEIKGARRWISLPGMTLQPSEFLKPCFAVVAAWLLAEGQRETVWYKRLAWPGLAVAIALLIGLILRGQPDLGMTAVILGVFIVQLFVNGLNLLLVGGLIGLGAASGVAAYFTLPHFTKRINQFWDPTTHKNDQLANARQAFGNGGLWGLGAGEGRVKDRIADAHADFVYAVAGEEFGFVVCMGILGLFVFIVLRALLRVLAERDLFVVLATAGLAAGFGLQAFVNMASTMGLIPTKGMTLPFVSYGGSSALAVAVGIGMLLALTRKRTNGDLL